MAPRLDAFARLKPIGPCAIAETIAQNKELTRSLLSQVGVPGARGSHGEQCRRRLGSRRGNRRAGGRETAIRQSRPRRGDEPDHEQVMTAYANAAEESSHIIVEKFAPVACRLSHSGN